MVPRTGPFSASCAFWRMSWYQRGKSSARGVSTGALAIDGRVLRALASLGHRRANPH